MKFTSNSLETEAQAKQTANWLAIGIGGGDQRLRPEAYRLSRQEPTHLRQSNTKNFAGYRGFDSERMRRGAIVFKEFELSCELLLAADDDFGNRIRAGQA